MAGAAPPAETDLVLFYAAGGGRVEPAIVDFYASSAPSTAQPAEAERPKAAKRPAAESPGASGPAAAAALVTARRAAATARSHQSHCVRGTETSEHVPSDPAAPSDKKRHKTAGADEAAASGSGGRVGKLMPEFSKVDTILKENESLSRQVGGRNTPRACIWAEPSGHSAAGRQGGPAISMTCNDVCMCRVPGCLPSPDREPAEDTVRFRPG
eukprot:SAG22_NODE_290_length_12941_cov_3.715465_3_plen_212_part_00